MNNRQGFTCKFCNTFNPFDHRTLLHPEVKVWVPCNYCKRKALILLGRVIEWAKG